MTVLSELAGRLGLRVGVGISQLRSVYNSASLSTSLQQFARQYSSKSIDDFKDDIDEVCFPRIRQLFPTNDLFFTAA